MIHAEEFLKQHPVVHTNPVERTASDELAAQVAAVEQSSQESSYFDQFIDEDFDICKEAALRLLDAAPRSSGALRERLQQKGYEDEVIDRVITRLIEISLLDDEAYARSVMQQCLARLKGAQGARMTMRQKGVDRQLAEQIIQETQESGAFDEAAWELGRQVYRKTQRLDIQIRRRRFWSAAGRKGHNPGVISDISHELFSE